MKFPAQVEAFLEWLESENIKPGVTPERQDDIAQTMCDLFNRRLLVSSDSFDDPDLSQKDKKRVANRMAAQRLLRHAEISDALAGALACAEDLHAEGHDSPEEFAHGVVWFIREYATMKMLPALWREAAPAGTEDGDWANLIWAVTNSLHTPKLRSHPQEMPDMQAIRRMAFPEGRLRSGYRVWVDDNADLSRFNPRWCFGEFEIYEDALAAARQIVEISLSHAGLGNLSPEEVFEGFSAFGDDPFIEAIGNAIEPESKFSAWGYAASIIKDQVSPRGVPPHADSNPAISRNFPAAPAGSR
jgi:hypothetical protein